jgi:tripartite-type tricarboxylate transporter receptor subunit TctC
MATHEFRQIELPLDSPAPIRSYRDNRPEIAFSQGYAMNRFTHIRIAARTRALTLAIFGAALTFGAAASADPAYPSRPVTIINPLAAGGGADNFLRALAREMQSLWGQPVLVESRPGAGGLIAGEFVARAKPDGYVIGDLQSTQLMPEVFEALRKANYTYSDLRVAVRVFYLPSAFVSRAGVPWKDMTGFVGHVRANPNQVTFGQTTGEGHPLHLLARAMFDRNAMKVVEVPFKGAGDAVLAILGGHVDTGYPLSISSVQAHSRAGKMSILAIDSLVRNPALPEIPTLTELGFDPQMAPNYHVFAVPKSTPDGIVQRIHDAVRHALGTEAIRDYARRQVVELYYGSARQAEEEVALNRRQIIPPLEQMLRESSNRKR